MNANPYSNSVPRHPSSSARSDRPVRTPRNRRERAWDDHFAYSRTPVLPLVVVGLLLAIALATAGVFSAHAAAVSIAKPKLIRLSTVEQPGLLLKSEQPGFYVTAPTLDTDIQVDITAEIARTIVTQRFVNPSDGWVEGVYAYPLPEGSAVDTLKMIVGKRVIEGIIKERVEARQIYEQAKAEGKKAALMEQERPNLFTNSVANIGPGETVVVQIEYQEAVHRRNGISSLRIPLVVAPRYVPQGDLHLVGGGQTAQSTSVESAAVPDADKITPPVQDPALGKRNPVSLTIRLDSGFPLGMVESPHHKMTVTRSGDNAATLVLADGDVPADRDFELTWSPKTGAESTASLFREKVGDKEYVLAIVTPPASTREKTAEEKPAREIVYVIDNSGSMSGPSMEQAKQSLDLALSRLTPKDRFNVIRFDDTMDAVFQWPVDASELNVDKARQFVAGLSADGGTEMLPALRAALIDADATNTERLRQVVFLTDGAIGNEEQMFTEIKQNRGRSRIFTVGIGSAPNSYFMTRAAMVGRGTFTHIGSGEQVAERMAELFRMLEAPVMTDLEAQWPRGVVVESWPNPLPDLYSGEPVVVIAQTDGADGSLTLTGQAEGKEWKKTLDLSTAVDGKGVGRLWARRKIAELEGRRYGSDNGELFDKAILKVALEHHLVTRLTSLVAVEKSISRPEGEGLTRADIPLNLPAGWDFEKIFGEKTDTREALNEMPELIRAQYASLLKVSKVDPAIAAAKQKAKGVTLPEGSTLADQKILIGLLSILLAMSLMVVAFFWRHLAASSLPPERRR